MSRKPRFGKQWGRTALLLASLCAMSAWSSAVAAQSVPTGIQEYFILGYDQHVWDMMSKVEAGEGGGPFASAMNSLVTATASADNQVVYYDHWEDGLEADVFTPVQASTLIIGDGNSANGDACDFNNDPCGVDLLRTGDFVNFTSNAGILAGCTVPSAAPLVFTELCSSVPVNPRCAVAGACTAAEVRFDGGDLLESTGGPLSLVHSQDPLTQFIGGSTEVISKQAVAAARSYSVPIGEDLYLSFGCPNCVMEPFHYVDLNLVAFEDNTQVFVDSPGAGTVSFTLNRGEHWSSLGFIDDNPFDPSQLLTINAGTKVSTTAAIAGMMFTGGDGQWATRHYTLLPDILHSTDYVITAPGDDPAVTGSTPNRPHNLYLHNPDPLNAVSVTATDTIGTTVINIPANSVVDYFTAAGRFVPNGSTVRMVSNRNFWGISAYDYSTNIGDWGHSWLATKFLTRNYTVSFAPGTLNPPVDMVNLNAVFIAATADNTRVQIDFDNDGVFDVIDLDGDGIPDAAPLPGNTYTLNALSALSVFDPNDFDNTGTRIVANKPVAISWGQDNDLTDFGDTALDTGFTVYPTDQLFLDPVLVLVKDVDTPVVPTAGGTVTYNISISTFSFSPITNLVAYDLLPPGVTGGDYVPGSTLVTYPNLTQDTTDPVASIDPGTGRDRLDWTLNPDTMGTSQTLTIRYSVAIPPAPGGVPQVLINEAQAQGNLGASVFSPFDTAVVVQSDLVLAKSVADDGTPEPGDVLTYTLNVSNNGLAAETNAIITDVIPPNTTFLAGSITSSGPFAGTYSAAQNAVVWTATSFPVGGPHALTFQVTINPGVPAATTIANSATYESNQTPLFPSTEVDIVTVGPALVVAKDGPTLLHPNEIAAFEITVENVGDGTATNVRIVDPFLGNLTYVAESMEWRTNVNPYGQVTDAADTDAGTQFIDRLELLVGTLVPGQDLTFRFQIQVDPGTAGLFVNNQATVSSTEVLPTDTNLVQIPIVGNANLAGHVFLDLDGDGVQDPGEPDLANIGVEVVDATGVTQIATTDANGDYLVTIEPGNATVDVDETDRDFPAGATLTTANDPQVVNAVAGTTVASGDVGYDLRPLTFSKTSDAPAGGLVPGDTMTYTLETTNTSGIDQTTVTLSDPLPPGTFAVPGSTQVTVTNRVLRVSEYFIPVGSFGGTVFDLVLDQALVADYFAIVQGSAGNAGTGGDRDPEADYARLTQDPFATGDLAASVGADVLRLERRDGADGWVGSVTVVECLSNCDTTGFNLVAVEQVLHPGAATSGSDTAAAWTDINQVMLMGGFNGAGCYSDETTDRDHPVCHARFFPSGSDQINWTRDGSNAAVNLTAATSTVMVVEWGSEWTVQRVRVTGTNGGNGLNATSEYNTAAINPVTRSQTWVWGAGHANGNGIGNQAEGVAITLGNGVAQNATESLVAVGTEIAGTALDFEVWALTHPLLSVDYRFKADGDAANLIVDVPMAAAGADRMALVTNGQAGTSDNYPRPIFSARYLDSSTVRLERRRFNSNFPAWVQGIDFSSVAGATRFTGGDPANLVTAADGVALVPDGVMTVTFQVKVDPNLAPAITQIANTATLDTDQETPSTASVTDHLVRLGIIFEPNNAGFAVAGGTVTYNHVVTNTGQVADSYDLTLTSELGYTLELIDPTTGSVIATDSNGDGVWDGGGAVTTGTLNPGESVEYRVRVNVPGGTPLRTEETTTLTAVSDRSPFASAFTTDETTVVESIDVGPVMLVPDQSGVAAPGGSIVYTHAVTNNSGATDTFDLTAFPALPGWTATIYADSNGDGVYTPGIDLAVVNTLQLADSQLQTLFVVVDAPAGAMPGDTDVVTLTATSRNDPTLFDGATDTTTVIPAASHDLSGGGTLLVDQGDTPLFPGTVTNISETNDRFDFTITASLFLGLDGLLHPTQLWIDTDADGVPDTQIAEDADGDGTWDTIAPGFDTDADSSPDVAVAAGAELAYELRRPVDPMQLAYRDPVTLSATSQATGEVDSVTATILLAAATRAVVAGFDAYHADDQVVVEWQTVSEVGTVGFYLVRLSPDGAVERRPAQGLLPGLLHAPQGGSYRFVDESSHPGERYTYQLVEVDSRGKERRFGPFDAALGAHRSRPPDLLGASYVKEARRSPRRPVNPVTRRRAPALEKASPRPSGKLRVPVEQSGLVHVAAADLAAAFGTAEAAVRNMIGRGRLRIWLQGSPVTTSAGSCPATPPGPAETFSERFSSGDSCAWTVSVGPPTDANTEIAWLPATDKSGLYFFGQAIDSIYARSNVYWIGRGPGRIMETLDGGSPAPAAGAWFLQDLHFERELYPLTSVVEDPDSDFWFWDFFIAGDPANGTKTFTLTTPGAVPAAGGAALSIHLHGQTDDAEVDPDHHLVVRWNGVVIGEGRWDGGTAHTLEFPIAPGLVLDGDNTVEIEALIAAGVPFDVVFLEAFDVTYPRFYRAFDDMLEAPADGAPVLTFAGFDRDDVVTFDVTDPNNPGVLADTTLDRDGGGHRLSFVSTAEDGRYLALPLAQATEVVPEVDLRSDLLRTNNRAEYLVIAGAGLEAAAESLADYRRGQGLTALVVRIQDVYDEFSGGIVSPWAIRDLLAYALSEWRLPPRWVVLAGDSSFDYKDHLGFGENFLPAPLTRTPDGLFVADNRLADLTGGDGVPEVALGRLPFHTADELTAYVARLRAYEATTTAPWKQNVIWVADDADEGGEFVSDMETLIPFAASTLASRRIYVDEIGAKAARQEFLAALEAGALLVNYLGHGGPDRLADEGLLVTGDVAALTNGERAPLLTALTCSVGRYDLPGFDTLSENLLLHPNGGALALWSPSSLSFNADARRLGEAFLRAGFGAAPRLGDATRAALAEYAASKDPDPVLPFVFILLGDPAIRLSP